MQERQAKKKAETTEQKVYSAPERESVEGLGDNVELLGRIADATKQKMTQCAYCKCVNCNAVERYNEPIDQWACTSYSSCYACNCPNKGRGVPGHNR